MSYKRYKYKSESIITPRFLVFSAVASDMESFLGPVRVSESKGLESCDDTEIQSCVSSVYTLYDNLGKRQQVDIEKTWPQNGTLRHPTHHLFPFRHTPTN